MFRCGLISVVLVTVFGSFTAVSDDFNSYQPLGTAQVSAITPTATRTVIDLSGPWDIVDDGEISGTMDIPSSKALPDAFVIRKSVTIKKATLSTKAWHLLFLGVTDEVDLWVNGRSVMRYPGGSAPFMARIPDQILTPGENIIELRVSEKSSLASLVARFAPHAPTIHRGVFREVFLVGTPQVWASDVRTSTTFGRGQQSASLVVEATINGNNVDKLAGRHNADEALRQGNVVVGIEAVLTVRGTGIVAARSGVRDITIARSRSEKKRFDLSVTNPLLWSPQDPNLYELEVRITYAGSLVDVHSSHLGLRLASIENATKGRALFLNGKQTYVHGIDYAEESSGVGASQSFKQMERDVSVLKTLGVNLVRFSHRAPHPYMLHLCDKYGLMVLVELGVSAIPRDLLGHEEITALITNRAELIGGVIGTHSSIIGCGLSDGLQEGTDETNTFHSRVNKILRKNSSVLLYKVVPGSLINAVSEGGFDVVVVAMHGYEKSKDLTTVINDAQRIIRNAAVLITSGSLVSPTNMNGFSDPLSNESQALTIRNGFEAAKQAQLAGMIVETFNDHSLELPTMLANHTNPYERTSGLVDVWRQPRIAFQMYKALINEEKEPLLQTRDVDDATPLVFIGTGLFLALILTFIVNRSRRFREYVVRALVRPYNFYADIRDQRILSLFQTMLFGLVIACGAGLVLAALLHYLRTDVSVEYLLHILIPSVAVQELLRYVAWEPAAAVATFGALVFVVLIGLAIKLRVASMFTKSRILFRDTFTIVVWSAVPLLILLPLGVVLYQVLSNDAITFWIPLIVAVVAVWTLFRVLKATAIVFDVSASQVYLIGTGVLVGIVGLLALIWALQLEGFAFLQYYNDVAQG